MIEKQLDELFPEMTLNLNPARPKNQASSPVFLFPDCMFKAC
jgi:hypothetical protein